MKILLKGLVLVPLMWVKQPHLVLLHSLTKKLKTQYEIKLKPPQKLYVLKVETKTL